MRRCACAGSCETAHFAHAWRHVFAWHGPYCSTPWPLHYIKWITWTIWYHKHCIIDVWYVKVWSKTQTKLEWKGTFSDVATHMILFYIQSNRKSSNTDGSFIMANSNAFLSPYKNIQKALENKLLTGIFLFCHEIICCVNLLESPHRSDSNEYTHHTLL